jgi:hypothetical protein
MSINQVSPSDHDLLLYAGLEQGKVHDPPTYRCSGHSRNGIHRVFGECWTRGKGGHSWRILLSVRDPFVRWQYTIGPFLLWDLIVLLEGLLELRLLGSIGIEFCGVEAVFGSLASVDYAMAC